MASEEESFVLRKLGYSFPEGPGPVVILASPLCAPFNIWDKVVAHLAGRFRILRFNQPGHGGSDVPQPPTSTTFHLMAADVHHLLQVLGVKDVFAWIGVSMGAALGIIYATEYKGVVKHLVVCDTIKCSPVNAGIEDAFGPRVEAAKRDGMAPIVASTMERWFGSEWLDANPEEATRVRDIMLRTKVEGFEACCSALRSPTFDLSEPLTKIGESVETVDLIVGEKDADLPQAMEKMRATVEQSVVAAGKQNNRVDLIVIPNAGHVCFVDGFSHFTTEIDKILNEKPRKGY